MLIDYQHDADSIILRVKILNSSVTTGAGLTGLTFASAGLILSTIADNEASATAYTQAGGTIETIATLGTYAAPTATKCRFKEVDSTNHPGVYEIQFADARYAVASAKSLLVSISGATNAAQTDAVIPLRGVNPFDGVRGGMTALPNAAADAAGGLPISDAGGLDLDAKLANTNEVTAARMGALTDWIDAGRLDLILDAIAADVVNLDGATMRGTDSAALAATALSNAIWTDAKAGYIPAGLMPTQAEVLAIQNNTRVRVIVPPAIERPDAGSTTYRLWLYLYDTAGNMEAPDALPTITAQNNTGTDRSVGLSAVTNPSTGVYYADYTVASSHAIEGLLFQWSVVEGGVTRTHGGAALVVDTTAVDFTAADRTKLETLATDYTTARAGKIDNLDAAISTRSTYAGADTAGTTTLLSRCAEARLAELDAANLPADVAAVKSDTAAILLDTGTDGVVVASGSKTGYSLAAAGLDSIVIEIGLNARQALSILAAGIAGVLAGAATTTITIAAAGVPATNRITATVDADGNRSVVTLSAPA